MVGKPAPAFFGHVLGGAGTRPDQAVMVGDDIESDIGGALGAGLAGVLVRTGKYRRTRFSRAASSRRRRWTRSRTCRTC